MQKSPCLLYIEGNKQLPLNCLCPLISEGLPPQLIQGFRSASLYCTGILSGVHSSIFGLSSIGLSFGLVGVVGQVAVLAWIGTFQEKAATLLVDDGKLAAKYARFR